MAKRGKAMCINAIFFGCFCTPILPQNTTSLCMHQTKCYVLLNFQSLGVGPRSWMGWEWPPLGPRWRAQGEGLERNSQWSFSKQLIWFHYQNDKSTCGHPLCGRSTGWSGHSRLGGSCSPPGMFSSDPPGHPLSSTDDTFPFLASVSVTDTLLSLSSTSSSSSFSLGSFLFSSSDESWPSPACSDPRLSLESAGVLCSGFDPASQAANDDLWLLNVPLV